MENKFWKGLILGVILTVATFFGIATNNDWEKISKDLKKDYKSIFKKLKKSLNKIENVTKEDFDKIVDTVIEDYSKTKEITNEAKNSIILVLNNKWNENKKKFF